MSKIALTAASRVGCVRSNNEDMVFAYNKFVRSDAYLTEFDTRNADRFLVAVADGMGGHQAGEVASETALSNLKFFLSDLPRNLDPDRFHGMLVQWLASINQIVDSLGREHPEMREMGTTLVALIFYGGHLFTANCGDSRLYRLRGGRLVQLTTDHSLNNMTGQKKHSNIITNCIGAGCKNSYFDFDDITGDFQPGDVYLLCSDGLNDMVADDDIARLLAGGATANQLCEEAIQAGGFDNVSACLLKIEN
jgi:protein phosphatase